MEQWLVDPGRRDQLLQALVWHCCFIYAPLVSLQLPAQHRFTTSVPSTWVMIVFLIQFVLILPRSLQPEPRVGWPGSWISVLGTSESLFWPVCERDGADWVPLPDCRVWDTCSGHCFHLLSLVASSLNLSGPVELTSNWFLT